MRVSYTNTSVAVSEISLAIADRSSSLVVTLDNKAAATLVASVTSALASTASNLVPSVATSRPSTVPDTTTFPVTSMPVAVVANLAALSWYKVTAPLLANSAIVSLAVLLMATSPPLNHKLPAPASST